MEDISLDSVIIGRVDPHIYAFTTGTVPNYLKVGDTYRPVSVRLNEWKEHFPDLQKQYEEIAKVDKNVYFRDFAIHSFLENEKKRIRLEKKDLPEGVYYSREFFKETTANDIAEAIEDITLDYQENQGKYQFYNAETQLPETFTYIRKETYSPRPNQEETIKRFKKAIDAGRTNLLMYAVMRFGKSFTSMCCAVEMNANIVAIVSAKADVKNEWKKTIESHIKFSEYEFLDGNALLSNGNVIKETLDDGKKVALFLTLQDLQGESIKEKHKEVFENQIDLLIVDETHFGARAEKYGQVLRELGKEDAKATINKKDKDDFVEFSEAEKQINKTLNARIRLHLSGTPYRILMSSEFTKDDIIAFYQFSDIVKDQEQWDRENVLSDDVKEWDNPYYGFPQMVRFAFHPNESSRSRLKELRENGISFAFSALLKPKSVKKSEDKSHKQFIHEPEILDLLEVIDGSKDDSEVLGFLDYDKIKEGNMCRHVVMVLPYCASCDAMEALIRDNADKFKNLNSYEIVNISGLDVPRELGDPQKVKSFIHHCEEENQKTLTLTVNRMLTGSTVEEWDTMIFLKDTASPQEYDQAIFRLQNQYIKKYIDSDGNIIKYNMKPQTLLVDFDPDRMFSMQEQKAQIYNVNVDEAGNSRLEERLQEELRISPIIVMNKDKIGQIEPSDILSAVSEYSKSRGVAEETLEIPVDLSLLDIDVIRKAIEKENELGSKAGLTINPAEGEGTDMETGNPNDNPDDNDSHTGQEDPSQPTQETESADDEKTNDPVKQFRSYYARILFFAFLTKDNVISLEDIIDRIESEENARISNHIGISKPVLESMQRNINKFVLRDLDYKIQNLNTLSKDTAMAPLERAKVSVHKFGRLGSSEIITPKNICDDMVALIPDDGFTEAVENGHKFLDIAGKAGEFALALYERYLKLDYSIDQIRNMIYTIPTSGLTYEFTRMIYEILGLNVNAIAERFTSYDLLKIKAENGDIDFEKICSIVSQKKSFNEITVDDEPIEGDDTVKFEAVVGNPPYQEEGISTRKSPIYNYFYDLSFNLSSTVSLITPARFLFKAGQTPKEWNERMLSNEHFKVVKYFHDSKDVFENVEIKGGLVISKYNSNKLYGKINVFTPFEQLNTIFKKVGVCTTNSFSSIISSQGIYRFSEKAMDEHPEIKLVAGKGTGCKIVSNMIDKLPEIFTDSPLNGIECIKMLGKTSAGRVIKYIPKYYLQANEFVGYYNVLLPESNGSGAFDAFSSPIIAGPNFGSTDTFISIGKFKSESEALNTLKYIKTRFLRTLVGVKKATQHNPKAVWEYVPMQDFTSASDIDWSKSISEIDQQLYKKYGLSEEEIKFIEEKIKPME